MCDDARNVLVEAVRKEIGEEREVLTTTGSLLPPYLPYFAPLSSSLVEHSLTQYWQSEIAQRGQSFNIQQLDWVLKSYLERVRDARRKVVRELDVMADFDKALSARHKKISASWVRRRLAEEAPASFQATEISKQTLKNLAEGNVLRKQSWGVYYPDSVAATLMLRMIHQERERNWYPSQVPTEEEWYWVWSQEHPGAPIVPCPYPQIPINLNPKTLLWTGFAGASWGEDVWYKIGTIGAVTFAGLIMEKRHGLPMMSLSDLEVWGPTGMKGKKTKRASPAVDASLGLPIALQVLEQYQHSGLLHASVSFRGIGKGRGEIQLVGGKVVDCSVVDREGQRHPLRINDFIDLEGKRGHIEWSFLPQTAIDSSASSIQAQAKDVLRRLAAQIFDEANLKNV